MIVSVAACGATHRTPAGEASKPEPTVVAQTDPAALETKGVIAAEAWSHEDALVPVSSRDPIWGDPTAPVTLVFFADLQCPFTARAYRTIEALREDYGRRQVRIVFKHFPLPFHDNARPAAVAASVVHRLGGPDAFWGFVDRALSHQDRLVPEMFETWAREVGVDVVAFKQAMRDPTSAEKVDRDLELVDQLDVGGTPSTFVNGQLVNGAQTEDVFRRAIDDQLVHARVLVESGEPVDRLYVRAVRDSYRVPEREEPAAESEPEPDLTEWKVPVDRSPVRGAKDALVTIVVFADFQCPYCKRANETLAELLERYPGDLRVVWKDRPLPFHERAKPAAVFARAARAQRGDAGFWAAHDKLFENQDRLEDADLERYAQELKLNVALVRRALSGTTYDRGFTQDEDLAIALEARGTPTFFINGRRLVGAQPVDRFVALIDEQLVAARAAVKAGTPRTLVYAHLQRDAKEPPPPPPPEQKSVPAPTADQPWRGGRFAKVVIQEFSDFQCPFCDRVEPTLAQLEQKYGNRIKIVWRHLPLPFHPQAQLAAEASVEVFKQKGNAGFWAFKDKLYANNDVAGGLERPALERYAAELGLDMDAFRQALDQRTHRAAVQADSDIASQAGIRGTPSFVINGYFVSGAQPQRAFERIIDRALREP